MKLSIVTVNFNHADQLDRTIRSVREQSSQRFEFIIIDGGSTDESIRLIENNQDLVTHWVSEPDDGIYAAMNKGIRQATGDYVYFLNSGDRFSNPEVIENFLQAVGGNEALGLVYGDIRLIRENGEPEVRSFPDPLRFSFFLERTITHQAVFFKRELFERHAFYSEDLKLVADWEFLICAICKWDVTYARLPIVVCDYDLSGISSRKDSEKQLMDERDRVLQRHFPTLVQDAHELITRRRRFKSKRFQAFFRLERNKPLRSLNYGIMRFLNLFVSSGK